MVELTSDPSWPVAEVLRIDAEAQDLVPFDVVAPGPRTLVAVPQRADGVVLIFDSRGHRVGALGRAGHGPGELAQIVDRLGWVGDSLWVAHGSGRGVSMFTAAGTFIRRFDPGLYALPGNPGGKPTLVVPVIKAILENTGTILAVTSPTDGSTGVQCTCHVLASESDEIIRVLMTSVPSRHPDIDVPYAWRRLRDEAPDGRSVGLLVFDDDDRFRVVTVASSGDTLADRLYIAPSFDRVTAAEIDARLEWLAGRGRSPPPNIRTLIPEYHEPYDDMVIGRDGTVWIRLKSKQEHASWVILDERGDQIGSVSLPASVKISEADRSRIWGVHQNEGDGFRDAVIYQIRH